MTPCLPISEASWGRLIHANREAVAAGWAGPGVFATGAGPEYRSGVGSLFYVGKSAGPLGKAVGSSHDQMASGAASTAWMIERRNLSAFWRFADKIDPSRRQIAWTNVCKMDRVSGQRPPSDTEWAGVAEPCIAALADEIEALAPRVVVFATSGLYQRHVSALLGRMSYEPFGLDFDDGWTTCSRTPDGDYAIETKHPQGWDRASRDRVVALTMRLMAGGEP